MDFGSNSFTIAAATTASDDDAAVTAAERHKQEKWYGSGLPKQGRSGTSPEDELRGLKTAKIASFDDFSSSKAMQRSSCSSSSLLRSCNNFFSEGGQQMLSFSSPKSQTVTLPFYYHAPSSNSYLKNTAYDNGGLYGGSILAGVKGPFTPSQWMELEHQALIYKYIDANARVPTYLLNPIRKALDSAGFASFVGLRPVTYGWGGYNLGYSNNTDPEPGRCRRTDGKKWRCSREAVADHKYCERHMNRGRHRSRKPVEGQSGHSISGTKDTSSAKQQQPIVSSPLAAAVVPGGGASNSLSLPTHNQLKSSFPCAPSQTSAPAPVNRTCLDKEDPSERYQDFTGLSMISSPSLSLKGNQYSFPEQSSFQESRKEEFGQVCSGSLLNPFNESSSLLDSNTYVTSEDLRHCKNTESDNGLRQLFVDWPSRQSEQTWPEIDPASSERTQLSISIPIPMAAASDFMSSTSSPTIEKVLSSPLRLSRDLEKTTQMGLAVGTTNDQSHREEANWIPISWESSMGGPLGEVLHNTNNTNSGGEAMIPSALNLMTEGWDGSPYVATSPTGHLHKSTFVSLSNSSAGSSPRAETSPALRSTLINSALPGV